MNAEPTSPSSALSPLARARLDELLGEMLSRVSAVMDSQERLRGLLDAVVVIAGDLSLKSVLEQIVSSASDLVDAQYVALGVLGTGRDRRLQEFITHGLDDDERELIGELPRGKGLLGHIIDHPEALRLSDLHDHAESFGFPANHPPMTTFIGVPIRIRDKVFGNLYLTEKRGGANFTIDDEEIVIALAAAAGVVIENARLYEEGARREAWLAATTEITAALLGPVNRQEALQLVADRARAVASADIAAVLLVEADDTLALHVVSGASPGVLATRRIPRADSLVGSVVASGDMFVVEDASLHAGARTGFEDAADWPTFGPLALFPLRSAAGVSGVLLVGWARDNADVFHEVDLQLPSTFAEQAALALEVTKAREDQALLAVFADRDRIGRDLHDLVIQRLFAIGLTLENTTRMVARPEAAERISSAVDEIDATIKDIRRSIFSLSVPDDSSDLKKDLASVVEAAAERLGFMPVLRTSGPLEFLVPNAVRPHLIAAVTEAVSNAARHGEPAVLVVNVAVTDAELVLDVTDDGKGFDPATRHRDSGIANMAYRAETLGGSSRVTSGPGQGTHVVWRVPLPPVSS